MDKTYNPEAIEQARYAHWETEHYFAPKKSGQPYCIMLPPPNVTGSLHMGHGFQHTLMDILIRYHRMQGDNTLWQPGTDHAGIATQMVVERKLMLEGKTRHDLGREAFVEKVWEWKEESGDTITRQSRRLGTSMDWSRERFTLDEPLSHAVREVFIRLYEEGLIYRGTRLVNWDPKLLTAISDLEVVNQEVEGHLWHIRYPMLDQSGHLTVATTRPETLLGDVAVAVHPEDERYAHLIGKEVQLPLTTRTIPIIADEYVDKTFGSGCVKITPAHDFNDYAIGQRHQLTPINIFTPDAHLNDNAPKAYRGMDRFDAREHILKDLAFLGLLEKTEKHILKIPRGEKSDVVIEPYLTQQWFMKMKPLAEPAIRAVQDKKIRFIPENWSKTYFQWLENIEDWCISRQLWWGHRIPVWYDADGTIYVGHDEKDARARHQLSPNMELHQETDVLDTWFSAALWPFSTLGWPEKTEELKTFYPTSVLVTGFDIIFFWVARMIMMGLKFMEDVPFKEVFITGLIRDAHGQKMSKSKGNVLDPLDLIDGISLEKLLQKRTYGLMQPGMAQKIEKNTRAEFPDGIAAYGTDALRFTFCALASYGREIRFDIGRLEGYRNFCNKLWNAARYVLMNTENKNCQKGKLSLPDSWILSRLQTTIQSVHDALANYRFDLLAQALYEFVWNEFCDWYLELSKPILMSSDSTEEELSGTRWTLITVLENILRLLHPVMPFITEEIWQRVTPSPDRSIMLQPYPQFDEQLKNTEKEAELDWLKNIVIAIRTLRSEMNISPAKQLSILFSKGTVTDQKRFADHERLILTLAKLERVTWLSANDTPPESAIALVGDLDILIPMAGLIDKAEESARLTREIAKLTKETERAETKLHNPNFVDRAPGDVVEKERAKLAELKGTLTKLEKQLEKIALL
ncbi:MAG TPA: valine--tRNA ligase [Gammaproteobacteria bacterium]|nr:valine--tRNA ligase [Gammaproteobacteria bacterium]